MHFSSSLGDRSLVIEVRGLTAGYGLPLEGVEPWKIRSHR